MLSSHPFSQSYLLVKFFKIHVIKVHSFNFPASKLYCFAVGSALNIAGMFLVKFVLKFSKFHMNKRISVRGSCTYHADPHSHEERERRVHASRVEFNYRTITPLFENASMHTKISAKHFSAATGLRFSGKRRLDAWPLIIVESVHNAT